MPPLQLCNYKSRNCSGGHFGAQLAIELPAKKEVYVARVFLVVAGQEWRKRYMEKLMAIGGVDP